MVDALGADVPAELGDPVQYLEHDATSDPWSEAAVRVRQQLDQG